MRLPDWELRLAVFLRERQGMPFSWGRNDCALFTCDAVEAVTGDDPGYELRGYTNAAGAIRKLARWLEQRGMECPGWKQQPDSLLSEVARLICKAKGFNEVPTYVAQRGDVVIVDCRNEGMKDCENREMEKSANPSLRSWSLALGIVGLSGLPVGVTTEQGVVELDVERMIRAWRV